MPSRPSQRFKNWLDSHLQSLQPGNRLPTGQELARQWDLSVSTVRNILREYQKKGAVVLVPGRGAFVPQEEADPDLQLDPKPSSTQSIVDFVVASIRQGSVRIGEALPSIKYMSLQFKVAPMTVVRAYGQLRERGLVTRVGKTFWVGDYDSLARPTARRQAYFFHASLDYTKVFKSGWTAPAYLKMERELLAHGFSISYEKTAGFSDLAHEWLASGQYPDAVLFYKLRKSHVRSIDKPLRRLLTRADRLQVLLDWREGDYRALPRGRSVHILSRGNMFTTRAKAVADYAVRNRYDEVCFYFDENTTPYDMFLPIVRIRSELGFLCDACRFITVVRPLDSAPIREAFLERLHAERSPRQIATILSKYTPTSAAALEDECRLVHDLPDALAGGAGRRLVLFVKDSQALEAKNWALDHGVTLGEDLSLLSFENNPQYYHESISCCIPDWEQMGYLMAHSIIGDFPVARTHKGFVRVKADVLERGTT